jgi:hypothetical protein
VKNKYFENTIMLFIVTNTGVMALQTYNMSPLHQQFNEISNIVFAVVFNVEMFLKLIGLGDTYFLDSWNRFDMSIVIASDLGFILGAMNLSETIQRSITVIRSVRIMRMVRLIKSSVNTRLIFDTIMNILP